MATPASLNRVWVEIATTGTGTVTCGDEVTEAYCTEVEAGAVDTTGYTWMLEEGNDFQIFQGAYDAGGRTVPRSTTLLSKIAGTVGTSNMDLQGSATLRIVTAAVDAWHEWIASQGEAEGGTAADKLMTPQRVKQLVEALFWSTGDAKITYKTVADTGWILANDGSIGNGSSGATTRANADTEALFTLLYDNIAALVVQDSSGSTVARGADAATDFAANRRLVIPKALGRSLAVAGAGSGLTSRTLGATAGAETETPTIAKTATHDHVQQTFSGPAGLGALQIKGPWGHDGSHTGSSNIANAVENTGSGNALNILDPSTYVNFMIKL